MRANARYCGVKKCRVHMFSAERSFDDFVIDTLRHSRIRSVACAPRSMTKPGMTSRVDGDKMYTVVYKRTWRPEVS